MFTLNDLVRPGDLDDAYQLLNKNRNNTILGGCAFLKLGKKRIGTGIDLTNLGLSNIREKEGYLEIGAMTTLRDLEIHPLLKDHANGLISKSVSDIIGVQFRNGVTVGASVYAKYGFSDLLTALLALETEVELYKAGRMSLAAFLARPKEKDILVKLWLKKTAHQAAYLSFRNSASDFAVLNVAVARLNNLWTIVVGARPSKAAVAVNASALLSEQDLTEELIIKAAHKASEELSFGTNQRGSAIYRQALCKVLVKRGITEVLAC